MSGIVSACDSTVSSWFRVSVSALMRGFEVGVLRGHVGAGGRHGLDLAEAADLGEQLLEAVRRDPHGDRPAGSSPSSVVCVAETWPPSPVARR